jgi:hypothetical protein
MTKHTPGPWSIWTSNSFRRIVSDVTRREVLCGTVQRSDGCPDLYFPNGGHEGPDARLITAAPDLLEFAELVLRGIESGHIKAKPFLDMSALVGESIPMRTIGDAAREVIAKATGEKA